MIFKEFERYIKIMKMFKGIDWNIYVKMRNKENKNGDARKDYDDEPLLDEEEQPTEEQKNAETTENAAAPEGGAEPAQEEEKKEESASESQPAEA